MNAKTLAKIIIKCYDMVHASDFENIKQFLNVCLYHTKSQQSEENILNAIYYITDIQHKKGIE